MESILVLNGTIITVDPSRRIIIDGAVAIEGKRIVGVGETDDVKKRFRAEHRISARGKLVIPGLIQTHLHPAQALIRGCADDLPLIEWLRRRVWPLQGNYTREDALASIKLSMLELVKSGSTTFVGVDIHTRYGFDGLAEAVEKAGCRAVLAKSVMDTTGYGRKGEIMHKGMVEDREESLREARGMARKWNARRDGKVEVWIAPRSLGGCTKSLYEEVGLLARELSTGITMHLNEVREDVKYSKEKFGMRPVQFMKSVGMLGRHTLFAHMVWADEDEIRLLSKTGSSVAHCPSSNLKLGSGLPRIQEIVDAGVNVGLGCDGAPCNNTYDLIREMRIAAILQKGRLLNPEVMPAYSILEMATINGARALGMDRKIGSIEEGKRADLVILDSKKPHMTPSFNPVATIVYSANGSDVDTSIIDGEIVMRERNIETLDEKAVLRDAAVRALQVTERAGVKIPTKWPIL